jgi:hypothetical protein
MDLKNKFAEHSAADNTALRSVLRLHNPLCAISIASQCRSSRYRQSSRPVV